MTWEAVGTMLVRMRTEATDAEVRAVVAAATGLGCATRVLALPGGAAVGLLEAPAPEDAALLGALPGVRAVEPATRPYRLASWAWHPEPTVVALPNGARFGGGAVATMAAVRAPFRERAAGAVARRLRSAGVQVARLVPEAGTPLRRIARACAEEGLALAVEAGGEGELAEVAAHADLIVLGPRDMQNGALLREAGGAGKPVLLTRGRAATVEELLLAAERVMAAGNPRVVLCESGIRGFDPERREVLDLTAIPVVRALSHLPVVADPTCAAPGATGVLVRAAVAAGADGVVLGGLGTPPEEGAPSGFRAELAELARVAAEVRTLAAAVGREVPALPQPSRKPRKAVC